jgi:glycosyltransferase involved in cell wall biosynthesis
MNAQGAPPAKKVSVVVPVYNTEAFLVDCLDSLVNQTLDEIEIVVVNDGSPDGSQAIIDDYAARYPDKIVALSKPNGGLGSARNAGIARATGRYIGFVDSDDFVEPDMYQHLYEEAERTSSDVAICRYRHYSLDESYSVVGGNFPFAEGAVFPSEGFFLNSRVMIVVNKIYRADLVRRVPFQDTWFEDVAWSPVAMSYAERICYTPNVYYHYIMRDGTITTSHDDARTLEEVSSLRWALEHANPERLDQVAYMAARRLLFDAQARPAYADRFAYAVHELRGVIGGSHFVLDDPALYLAVRPYLADGFATIPKTILYSGTGRPDAASGFAFPVDARFVDVDELAPAPDDETARALADRPAALREYLQLSYLAEHGGVVLGDRLDVAGPIAWALAASASFFGFEDPETISPDVFGAVAGSPVVRDLLSLFRERLDEPSPLAAALDAHFLRSGRVAWDYEQVEASFSAPYAELDGGCRVYATSVFCNDFGLGTTTTSIYPLAVRDAAGEVIHYRTSVEYQRIARRVALDYAEWFKAQRKPSRPSAARRTIPAQAPAAASALPPRPAAPGTPTGERDRLPQRALASLTGLLRRRAGNAQTGRARRPETRPLAIRDPEGTPRVLLYVGGFTTGTSAERARLISTWLRDAHGAAEVTVLYTDRATAAQAARAEALTADGVTLLVRSTRGSAVSGDADDPAGYAAEWARVVGDERFDLVVVATPKGGRTEASILAAAPSGTRVLCRLGQDALPADSFDVVLDKLSELHRWVDDHAPAG